jgi:glycosyltransferase involved in cell wall biosynthesis
MRILYFHQHFCTPNGSGGTRSYEMARRLTTRGHQVTMVCGSYGGGASTGLSGPYLRGVRRGIVEGIKVIEFDLPYSNRDGLIRRTWTFLKFSLRGAVIACSKTHDVVFATSTPLTAGIPGIIAKIIHGTPFVFEVRDLWPELPRAMGVIKNPIILGMMSFLEFISYRHADRCIGLSPGIVKGICKRGIPENRVVMIPNGCDLELFSGVGVEAIRLAGVGEGDFVAAFAGAHGVANGLESLIDVARELVLRSRSDIKIAFIGDGKIKEKLQKQAESEGLTNCLFYPPLAKMQLVGVMKGLDVGLMVLANVPAFYYGTSPNKFFDYIAAALPVVNNYPGWLADMISKEGCGVVVPPGDSSAFADALQRLADDRSRLPALKLAARGLAERKFSRDDLAVRFIEVIEAVGSR